MISHLHVSAPMLASVISNAGTTKAKKSAEREEIAMASQRTQQSRPAEKNVKPRAQNRAVMTV